VWQAGRTAPGRKGILWTETAGAEDLLRDVPVKWKFRHRPSVLEADARSSPDACRRETVSAAVREAVPPAPLLRRRGPLPVFFERQSVPESVRRPPGAILLHGGCRRRPDRPLPLLIDCGESAPCAGSANVLTVPGGWPSLLPVFSAVSQVGLPVVGEISDYAGSAAARYTVLPSGWSGSFVPVPAAGGWRAPAAFPPHNGSAFPGTFLPEHVPLPARAFPPGTVWNRRPF